MILRSTQIFAILTACILIIVVVFLTVLTYSVEPSYTEDNVPAIWPERPIPTEEEVLTIFDIQPNNATVTDIVLPTEVDNTDEIKTVEKPAPILATPPKPTTPIIRATPVVTEKEKIDSTKMLQVHNEIRATQNLTPLSWSPSLAKSAESWSQTLKGESCEMRHDFSSPFGENIFWKNRTGGDVSNLVSDEREVVLLWAEEERHYNYKNNSCANKQQCGHYTQLVWANTTEVGCGVSSCTEDDSRTDVWVCRYNPPGNVIGQLPY